MKMAIPARLMAATAILVVFVSCNADQKNAATGASAKLRQTDSFYFATPSGWTTESISFPIPFAPGLAYSGTENLRFAKGWGDVNSEEHWCYAFAWWLNGKPLINAAVLQKDLTGYYSGLVQKNVLEKKITADKLMTTEATIKKMVTLRGDVESYTGIIRMLDYHSEKPMILNCMIHLKSCNSRDHTALVILVSPKALDHPVWKTLAELNEQFNCDN